MPYIGNMPISSTPVFGPPGYTGAVVNIGQNQANAGSTVLNPQALSPTLGSNGDLDDNPGAVGGQDPPGIAYYSGISGSGSDSSSNCMSTCQLNAWICDWEYFSQAYCIPCTQLSGMPDGPDAYEMLGCSAV